MRSNGHSYGDDEVLNEENANRDLSSPHRDEPPERRHGDEGVLSEIIREIYEGPDTDTTDIVDIHQQTKEKNACTSIARTDAGTLQHSFNSGSGTLSPASQNSGNSARRVHRVSTNMNSASRVESHRITSRPHATANSERAGTSSTHRPRHVTSGVIGVPRLRIHRPRREEITEITSVQQFFDDDGEESETPGSIHREPSSSARARTTNETDVARVERDRSNLRHVSSIKVLKLKCAKSLNSFVFRKFIFSAIVSFFEHLNIRRLPILV